MLFSLCKFSVKLKKLKKITLLINYLFLEKVLKNKSQILNINKAMFSKWFDIANYKILVSTQVGTKKKRQIIKQVLY